MTFCSTCEGGGLFPFVAADCSTPDEAVTAADLCFAICLCAAGSWYRSDVNAGHKTGSFGWQLWCAMNRVDPSRIYRLEDLLTGDELHQAGFSRPVASLSREAALLSAGQSKPKVRL